MNKCESLLNPRRRRDRIPIGEVRGPVPALTGWQQRCAASQPDCPVNRLWLSRPKPISGLHKAHPPNFGSGFHVTSLTSRNLQMQRKQPLPRLANSPKWLRRWSPGIRWPIAALPLGPSFTAMRRCATKPGSNPQANAARGLGRLPACLGLRDGDWRSRRRLSIVRAMRRYLVAAAAWNSCSRSQA
jgi:hypothetical protein